MHIVFAEHNEIVVAWVGQHNDVENPHVDGAKDVPQVADVGRSRKDQPPCCEKLDKAPIDQKLVDRSDRRGAFYPTVVTSARVNDENNPIRRVNGPQKCRVIPKPVFHLGKTPV